MEKIVLSQEIFDFVIRNKPILGKCFLKPSLKQIENAKEKFCISHQDEIFMLIDTSMFTNGKSGVAITSSGVYGNDLFSSGHGFNWEKIIRSDNVHIYSGNFCIDCFSISIAISKFPTQELVDIVNELSKILKEKYKLKTYTEVAEEENNYKTNNSENISNLHIDKNDNLKVRETNDISILKTGVDSKQMQEHANKIKSEKNSPFQILLDNYREVYSRNIFISPNIPDKKINGAIRSISKNTLDPNDILCLYDSTLFGSATEGTIFTCDKFYYKSLGSEPLEFFYKDIKSVRHIQNEVTDKNGNKKIEEYVEIKYNSDGNQLVLKYADCSSYKDFVIMLHELSKTNVEDKKIIRQPLEEMPSYIRITYLKIVINFLLSDDSQIDEKEFSQLYSLISRLKMNSEDRLALAEYKQNPEDTDSLTQKIVSNVDDVSKQEILFSLCKDFIYIQIDTKNIPYTKSKFIMDFARKNSISTEQLELFKNSIENDKKIFDDNIDDAGLETRFKSIASNAAAVGVPLAALYFSGSVVGLGAAGITSGLATLGLGGMLGFSSMVTGVGAVILIGIGAKKGVEHLTGQGEIDKRKKKEAMLLEVNKCLQKSINMLMEDLNSFTMRLTELISTHSNLSEALDQREEQIQKLVSQLKLLMGSSKYLSSDRDQAYLAAVKQKLPRHLDLERLAAITEEPTVKKYYAVITSFYNDNGNGALKENIDVDSAEQLAKILDSLGYFSVSSITKQGINKLKGLFN